MIGVAKKEALHFRMIIERISREDMKRIILAGMDKADDGSHVDLYERLKTLYPIVKQYVNDYGIKVVIQKGSEFYELFDPYLNFGQKEYLVYGMFGSGTSVFDIYLLDAVIKKHGREFALMVIPDEEIGEAMILYMIPLKRYYELLMRLDGRLHQEQNVS